MTLSTGLGLRSEHLHEIMTDRPKVSFFEVISENYMGQSGQFGHAGLRHLEEIRGHYPVILHGVSLNIGSVDDLNKAHLAQLVELARVVEPEWVSDHVCWTGVSGENLHDLLPLPYTPEALDHLVPRIQVVQEAFKRPLVLENVSSYLEYAHSEMTEWEFLSELVQRSGCELLLDVNNIYVSARNHGFDPLDFVKGVPRESVRQIHLAGHSRGLWGLVDTHDAPVAADVWTLYEQALARLGPVPTLIEWDARIPPLAELLAEMFKAHEIWSRHHDKT